MPPHAPTRPTREVRAPRPEGLEAVPCLLCGGARPRRLLARGQHGLPARVVICPNDSLVWLSPRWTAARYARFYAEEYDRHYRPALAEDAYLHGEHRNAAEIVERLRVHGLASCRSLLDVGAGTGRILRRVGEELAAGELCALEASQACAASLRSDPRVELVADDWTADWHLDHAGRFDLVVMRGVLEHMLDPVGVLRRVAAALAPEGAVYLNVPDMMAPKGSLRRYWFRVVHTYYFNEATLLATVARAGLRAATLCRERNEVWCVLHKGEQAPPACGPVLFRRQLAVIRRHLLRQWPADATYRALRTAVRCMPPPARQAVRALRRRAR